MSVHQPRDQSSDGVAFAIDMASRDARPIVEVSLQSVGFTERADLQRWVIKHPDIVGEGLLLVTSEFDQWEIRDQKVADRLDVLFLDAAGCPVVAELKRDRAPDTVDLQALKYAAYCSKLTFEDLVDAFARQH